MEHGSKQITKTEGSKELGALLPTPWLLLTL